MAQDNDLADPVVVYDLENHAFEPDGPFYRDLARQVGGAALDIGRGAGCITEIRRSVDDYFDVRNARNARKP